MLLPLSSSMYNSEFNHGGGGGGGGLAAVAAAAVRQLSAKAAGNKSINGF